MVRTTDQTPGRRRRSEKKQEIVLDAAQALFVSQGYELTSVDAIAARAGVSKRTIYDHFGDKQTVYRRLLIRVSDALASTIRQAIDQEITDSRELRDGLSAFAMRITTEAFPSSDYATFLRLSSQGPVGQSLPEDVRERPERMLEDRLGKLAADGRLHAPNPRRAAQHFTALTILLALEAIKDDPENSADAPEIPAIITDGVDAFLRAYS